jgi:hypothetical protein
MTTQELTALPLATLKEMAAGMNITGDKRRKQIWIDALIANEIYEQEAVQNPAPIEISEPVVTAQLDPELPVAQLPDPDPITKPNASIVAIAFIAIVYAFCQLLSTAVKLTVVAACEAYNLAVKVEKSIPTATPTTTDYFPCSL